MTKTNIVLPAKDIKVKDILAYENLIVGKEYLATGTLMDKQTGKPVTDDDGNPVTARKRFTAETKDGIVEILFEFSGVKLGGTVMVAFETVSVSGVEIMTHADMAIDGYCVKLDLSDVNEMVRLLRYAGNNLNQYAKKANETGSIYADDIRDLQERLEELWEMAKAILARLADIE